MSSSITNTNSTVKEIYLVRHGETDFNKLGIPQGSRSDTQLNEEGQSQARKLGEYLKNNRMKSGLFDLIITSPMKRTYETAKIIAKEVGYDENKIVVMNDLIEIDSGLLAKGKPLEDLRHESFFDDFFKIMDEYDNLDQLDKSETDNEIPEIFITKYDMESNKDVFKRVNRVIDFLKQTRNKKILVVSHNGTIGFINRSILNMVEMIKGDLSKGKNCHLTYYKYDDDKFKLILQPSTFFL